MADADAGGDFPTEVVNVKVKYIRDTTWDDGRPTHANLRAWMEDEPDRNAYIGRRGVVFVPTDSESGGGGKVRWPPRDSVWANPFKVKGAMTRGKAVEAYRAYIVDRLNDDDDDEITPAALEALRGKRLGCWCAPEACHGDVLRDLLEGDEADKEP